MVSGRPLISTTTTGLPVATMALARPSWCPGRPSCERLLPSPNRVSSSPTTSTTTSASAAAFTAGAIPETSSPVTSTPRAYVTAAAAPAALRIPSSIGTTSSGSPLGTHLSQHGATCIGQRADHRNAAAGGKWQRMPLVLQQHHRLDRGLTRQGAMRGREGDLLHPLCVAIAERILEQAQSVLGHQHAAHGGVDFTHRYLAAAHERRQLVQVGAAVQVDVDAGSQRQSRGLGGRGGDAVLLQFRYGVEVGDDHALEAPAVAQQAGQQRTDRKSTRLNSSHHSISYAVFCLKNK